eukprot:851688_1
MWAQEMTARNSLSSTKDTVQRHLKWLSALSNSKTATATIGLLNQLKSKQRNEISNFLAINGIPMHLTFPDIRIATKKAPFDTFWTRWRFCPVNKYASGLEINFIPNIVNNYNEPKPLSRIALLCSKPS